MTNHNHSNGSRLSVLAVIDNPGEPLIVCVHGTRGRYWQVHLDQYDGVEAGRAAHDSYARTKPEPAGTWGVRTEGLGPVWAVTAPAELHLPPVPAGLLSRASGLVQAALRFAREHEQHLATIGR